MTVQELMNQVNIARVAEAYIIFDYHFSDDNFVMSLREKVDAVSKLKYVIKENIELIQNAVISKADPHTIFILEVSDESYEDSWKKNLEGFLIRDNDVWPILDKDFHIFDNEGEAELRHYCLEMTPLNEVAGYVVADKSIQELGEEICAAYIFASVFSMGLLPTEREDNIKSLYMDLKEAEKGIEGGNTIPFDQAMDMLENTFFDDLSEEHKRYREAEKIFRKSTEEIREAHLLKVMEERHTLYINAIKYEFNGRGGQ